jgi:hypothetical protein
MSKGEKCRYPALMVVLEEELAELQAEAESGEMDFQDGR